MWWTSSVVDVLDKMFRIDRELLKRAAGRRLSEVGVILWGAGSAFSTRVEFRSQFMIFGTFQRHRTLLVEENTLFHFISFHCIVFHCNELKCDAMNYNEVHCISFHYISFHFHLTGRVNFRV